MSRILSLCSVVFFGCMIAGLYGILHDQLTYTISPEYYIKFKFYQFQLAEPGSDAVFEYPRIQVAIVGFLATWWVGLPVAIILGVFSLHPDRRLMMDMSLKSFLVTLVVAFMNGLYGLYHGFHCVALRPREELQRWFIPADLHDYASFVAVGSMHNESYIGGFYGLLVGVGYVGWRKGILRLKSRKDLSQETK